MNKWQTTEPLRSQWKCCQCSRVVFCRATTIRVAICPPFGGTVPLFMICPPWFFVPPGGHKCPPFWHLINKVLLSIKLWTSVTDIMDIYCKTASSQDTDEPSDQLHRIFLICFKSNWFTSENSLESDIQGVLQVRLERKLNNSVTIQAI